MVFAQQLFIDSIKPEKHKTTNAKIERAPWKVILNKLFVIGTA